MERASALLSASCFGKLQRLRSDSAATVRLANVELVDICRAPAVLQAGVVGEDQIPDSNVALLDNPDAPVARFLQELDQRCTAGVLVERDLLERVELAN